MSRGTTRTLDPISEVGGILTRMGLGSLSAQEDIRQLPGRNHNWIVTTDSGRQLFVKKLEGAPQALSARIRQCLAFDQIVSSDETIELSTPRLLGTDTEANVLVYALVDGASTAAELIRQ